MGYRRSAYVWLSVSLLYRYSMSGSEKILATDEVIMNKIYMIRGKKVMLDRDLAALYHVETKHLKRQVKRNIDRFPDDFIELTEEELRDWRRQIGTSTAGDKMGLRYAPYAFTEQGVAMLSGVLSSKIAIDVNIRIIRVFSRLRELMHTHKDILLKLQKLEEHLKDQGRRTQKNEEDIQAIFGALTELFVIVSS